MLTRTLWTGAPSVLPLFRTNPEALLRQATRSVRDNCGARREWFALPCGEVEDGSLDCHHKCDPLIVASDRSIVPICLVDKINLLACHLRLDVLEWWVPVFKVDNAFHVLLERCSEVGQWSPGIASGCSCCHAPNSSLLHILRRSH